MRAIRGRAVEIWLLMSRASVPLRSWFFVPIALAVILGLISVPVECALAAGPHSIFLEADSLATLQKQPDGTGNHVHHQHDMTHPAQETTEAAAMRAVLMDPFTPDVPDTPELPAKSARYSLPKTGGFAGDAIVSISMPDDEIGFDQSVSAPDSLAELHIPADRMLRGPEPPPP